MAASDQLSVYIELDDSDSSRSSPRPSPPKQATRGKDSKITGRSNKLGLASTFASELFDDIVDSDDEQVRTNTDISGYNAPFNRPAAKGSLNANDRGHVQSSDKVTPPMRTFQHHTSLPTAAPSPFRRCLFPNDAQHIPTEGATADTPSSSSVEAKPETPSAYKPEIASQSLSYAQYDLGQTKRSYDFSHQSRANNQEKTLSSSTSSIESPFKKLGLMGSPVKKSLITNWFSYSESNSIKTITPPRNISASKQGCTPQTHSPVSKRPRSPETTYMVPITQQNMSTTKLPIIPTQSTAQVPIVNLDDDEDEALHHSPPLIPKVDDMSTISYIRISEPTTPPKPIVIEDEEHIYEPLKMENLTASAKKRRLIIHDNSADNETIVIESENLQAKLDSVTTPAFVGEITLKEDTPKTFAGEAQPDPDSDVEFEWKCSPVVRSPLRKLRPRSTKTEPPKCIEELKKARMVKTDPEVQHSHEGETHAENEKRSKKCQSTQTFGGYIYREKINPLDEIKRKYGPKAKTRKEKDIIDIPDEMRDFLVDEGDDIDDDENSDYKQDHISDSEGSSPQQDEDEDEDEDEDHDSGSDGEIKSTRDVRKRGLQDLLKTRTRNRGTHKWNLRRKADVIPGIMKRLQVAEDGHTNDTSNHSFDSSVECIPISPRVHVSLNGDQGNEDGCAEAEADVELQQKDRDIDHINEIENDDSVENDEGIDDDHDDDAENDEDDEQPLPIRGLANLLPEPVGFKLHNFTFEQSFEVVIQYIASCLLNKEFAASLEEDEDSASYFYSALKKFHNVVAVRKDSLLSSQAWRTAFRENLIKYPFFQYSKTVVGVDCEACGRSNHPAKYVISLSGREYDSETTWRISWDSADGVKYASSAEGGHIRTIRYEVGRFCLSRSFAFHTFQHYKLHLTKDISDYLNAIEGDDFAKIQHIISNAAWMAQKYSEFQDMIEFAESYKEHEL